VSKNKFVVFHGAQTDVDDDGKLIAYTPRDDVIINLDQIGAAYDHTLMIMGHKIRVMETFEDIKRKLGAR